MFNDHTNGILCICGAFLIHFSLGTLYTFGNMSPYVASYLRLRTDNTWVTPGHMVWIFSLAVFSQGFTMSLGGLLEHKIGQRLTSLIGAWTMSISTILTYFSIKRNVWSVIVTYGFFFGCGTGLTYAVALAAPMKWYPNKKGLVTGTVVAGYGLGSLLFNIVQTRYINPLNISPNTTIENNTFTNGTMTRDKYFTNDEVLDRVPICFLIIGSTYAVMQLIGVIILMDHGARKPSAEAPPPNASLDDGVNVKETLVDKEDNKEEENKVETNDDDDEKLASKTGNGSTPSPPDEDTTKSVAVGAAIRMKKFWILWFTYSLNGIVIVTISSLYKAFGQTFINDDRFFSIVGAVAAIFNAGGRLVWGRLLDRFRYRVMMSALTISMAVIMGTFYLCSLVTTISGAKAMYFIWVCLLFFCLAGNFAMFPAATAQTFGNQNMAIIYGLVFAGYAVSSILGAVICSVLLNIINYGGQFAVATVTALLGLTLTQFFDPIRKSKVKRKLEHD